MSHEGLPFLLLKGPVPTAGIGLYLLPTKNREKPWLHPAIHLEGFCYCRASSPGFLGVLDLHKPTLRAGAAKVH